MGNSASKDLVLPISNAQDSTQLVLRVPPDATLRTVRLQLVQEIVYEFCFTINQGSRILNSQERNWSVESLLNDGYALSIEPKQRKRSLQQVINDEQPARTGKSDPEHGQEQLESTVQEIFQKKLKISATEKEGANQALDAQDLDTKANDSTARARELLCGTANTATTSADNNNPSESPELRCSGTAEKPSTAVDSNGTPKKQLAEVAQYSVSPYETPLVAYEQASEHKAAHEEEEDFTMVSDDAPPTQTQNPREEAMLELFAHEEEMANDANDDASPTAVDNDMPLQEDATLGSDDEILPHVDETVHRADSNNEATGAGLDQHDTFDAAMTQSRNILGNLDLILREKPLFCSGERRQDLLAEINELIHNKVPPHTTIGVLGNTGVGKSSLLNALLDEASILPTSGSRGCTAAVVELRFNEAFAKVANTPVYTGQVEFITLQEWLAELRMLVDECATQDEKKIYVRVPDAQRQPDASAAWNKINQVYGHKTMERYHGEPMERAYTILSKDPRVLKILKPDHSSSRRNFINVSEGEVTLEQAKRVLLGVDDMGRVLRKQVRRFGEQFRKKINDYVYRKGSGDGPQTWPLIRKVVLRGPWMALSTGACLVDLPGVRDANAARAKVSEHYLQNCSQIWIVAPIKRAVDDGTAKELMGENFKRRLLMDGQYSNISFICTQTDDCEATETIADHKDVAKELGVWKEIKSLARHIRQQEQTLSDLQMEEEALQFAVEDAKELLSDGEANDTASTTLQEMLDDIKEKAQKLAKWRKSNGAEYSRLDEDVRKLQSKLKTVCASVRNEYSTKCLQDDFRAGLDELVNGQGEEYRSNEQPNLPVIPDDYKLDVYCVSANDYLKLKRIKAASDGAPSTFSNEVDTQIPALREFIHTITSKSRAAFTKDYVDSTCNVLDRMKLVASDAKGVSVSGRASRRYKSAFEKATGDMLKKTKAIVQDFKDKSAKVVATTLQPALKAGADKGQAVAMSTVASWTSTQKRRRTDPTSGNTGLHFMTYRATVRRSGEYVSASAGEINMNQELCNPMEKEFSADWQTTMDASIKAFLASAESEVLLLCQKSDQEVACALTTAGVDPARLQSLRIANSRTYTTAVRHAFNQMKVYAVNGQRELSRSLLPKVRSTMEQSYKAALGVPGGAGVFSRMDAAMRSTSCDLVNEMFSEATGELVKAVGQLIDKVADLIAALEGKVLKTMEGVYSILWEDSSASETNSTPFSPEQQALVRSCRDSLLPVFRNLAQDASKLLSLVGMEREDIELEVVAVETFDEKLFRQLEAAKENGNFFDICDSDVDDNNLSPPLPLPNACTSMPKAKTEPKY